MEDDYESGQSVCSVESVSRPARFFSINGKCHVRLDEVVACGPIEIHGKAEASLSIYLASCQLIVLTGSRDEIQKDYSALAKALDQHW